MIQPDEPDVENDENRLHSLRCLHSVLDWIPVFQSDCSGWQGARNETEMLKSVRSCGYEWNKKWSNEQCWTSDGRRWSRWDDSCSHRSSGACKDGYSRRWHLCSTYEHNRSCGVECSTLLAHGRPMSESKTEVDSAKTNFVRVQMDSQGAFGSLLRKLGTTLSWVESASPYSARQERLRSASASSFMCLARGQERLRGGRYYNWQSYHVQVYIKYSVYIIYIDCQMVRDLITKCLLCHRQLEWVTLKNSVWKRVLSFWNGSFLGDIRPFSAMKINPKN